MIQSITTITYMASTLEDEAKAIAQANCSAIDMQLATRVDVANR